MEKLNIAHLIEKNSITRLTNDYENSLLMKIKENFNDNQQQLFVASFYCFLNYDKKNDFVIDFDNVWKWLGFSRKDNSKRLLEKFFTIDIDYKVEKAAPILSGAAFEGDIKVKNFGGAGLNKETIMLNINTFKKFCLKAGTKKADEVHDYYVKLEELLQETINEETNELKLQLSNNQEKLIETDKLLKEEILIRKNLKAKYNCFLDRRLDIDNKFTKGLRVYILGFEEIPDKYKIGYSSDLKKRVADYHTEVPFEPIVFYKRYVKDAKFIEGVMHHVLRKFRIHNAKEWFQTDNKQNFMDELDDIILFFENKDKKYQDIVDVKDYLLEENNNKDEVFDKVDNQKEEDVIEDEEQIIKEEILKQDEVDIKTCSNCKDNFTLDNFSKNPYKKDGLETYCKKCAREKYYKLKNKDKFDLEEKKCTKCCSIKDICHFYNRVGSSDGKTSECKDCTNAMYKDRVIKRENVEVTNKTCLMCNKLLDISNFGNKKDSPDGKMSYCKKCCSENAKLRRLEPKTQVSNIKKCNTCLNKLDITSFWNSSSNKDGKDNKCKNCHKESKKK